MEDDGAAFGEVSEVVLLGRDPVGEERKEVGFETEIESDVGLGST